MNAVTKTMMTNSYFNNWIVKMYNSAFREDIDHLPDVILELKSAFALDATQDYYLLVFKNDVELGTAADVEDYLIPSSSNREKAYTCMQCGRKFEDSTYAHMDGEFCSQNCFRANYQETNNDLVDDNI